ncbi:hypothetical protein [Helicobacter salomonis]|uniref:hypothetical protein n=1 Tax=Helicobacter salomonis TaxID=56878 RepID=UPI000CF181C8|nr:hypothetical protein [Helicobacter salomonis]
MNGPFKTLVLVLLLTCLSAKQAEQDFTPADICDFENQRYWIKTVWLCPNRSDTSIICPVVYIGVEKGMASTLCLRVLAMSMVTILVDFPLQMELTPTISQHLATPYISTKAIAC